MVMATASTIVRSELAPGSSAASRAAASLMGRSLEGVPDAVDGADEPRLVAVLAELAADPGDVGVHHPATRVVAVAPDPIHQLVARRGRRRARAPG